MSDPKTKIIISAEDQASGVFDGLKTKATGVAAAIAGAFAANQLIDFAQALAPIADAAANLEARLQLAVGANGDLKGALDDVRASANAAGADINSVGELYGRIASSTADLGFSQERVAGLTDTINKSFVVSGTSASAASGAITQLAQAFAAGALRGDEFNSVNEAAPRLMAALAAGLGVARGELRKMAEQGQLTTEVVLAALESQRDAIERDFATLPDTVGRATQRLANEWQVFIGNLNETTGASETVASGLNLIADNLDNIASVAATAGELVVSALAVKAAAALRGYITLTAASTAATTAKAAALTGLAAAGKAAATAMLTLGRALPGLAVAGAVAGVAFLVTKFFEAKSAAEDAEEAVAKLLADPPPNATADQIRLIATEAELARFKLAEVEKTFLDLRQKGQDAATALSNIAKASSIDSSEGIGKLLVHLDLLRQGAQATGQQIQTALADRLKKLSNDDLQAFGIQAEMAFNRGEISAQQLGVALDAQARAALQRLGVDADVALNGMSAKFTEAIGSVELLAGQYDRMSVSGVNASGALQQGLDAALKRASSPVELEALVALIERMGREGKLSGEQVEAALDKARQKADELTPGINSVAEALNRLGIQSDASLKKTAEGFKQAYQAVVQMGGSVREQREAFQRYAEAAIKANGGVADATLKARAAQHGLRIEADETGHAIVRAMDEGVQALDALGRKAEETAGKVGLIKREAAGLKDVWDENGNLIDKESAARTGERVQVRGGWEDWSENDLRRAVGGNMGKHLVEGAKAELSRRRGSSSGSDTVNSGSLQGARAGSYEPQQPREQITTYRVQIGTGAGRTQTINTASRADADALTSLLRQLESDMSRS